MGSSGSRPRTCAVCRADLVSFLRATASSAAQATHRPEGILMSTTSRTSDQHRSFVTAMAIDSVAAGVFQPATIIFLLATTHLGRPRSARQ